MLPPAVLWIDPGKVTGLAVYTRHPAQAAVDEAAFIPAGDRIELLCSAWGSNLWIGWEKFTITPTTPAADAHHAIEMIGVARRAALRGQCHILTAADPNQRKVATQEMLKALGWWRPGEKDAQSAAAHLLAWMLRSNCLPAREAGLIAPYLGR